VVEKVLAMSGTLRLPTGEAFDLSGCEATLVDVHSRVSSPQGRKPGGAAPANEAPARAVAVIGVYVARKHAAPAAR
jgi:hypothetical protein